MTKTSPLDGLRNVFRSGTPTKDAYTKAWIRLINNIEKRKNDSDLDVHATSNIKRDNIINQTMAGPAEGGRDHV